MYILAISSKATTECGQKFESELYWQAEDGAGGGEEEGGGPGAGFGQATQDDEGEQRHTPGEGRSHSRYISLSVLTYRLLGVSRSEHQLIL